MFVISRYNPSLPWRHFLLCGQGAQEAADEVPGYQDVPGEAEEAPQACGRLEALWRDC